MFSKYKTLILLLIFLIVIPLVGWRVAEIFLLNGNTKDFTTTLLNGLWTAYFALIFLGISTILKWIFNRERRHYNSLVNLGSQLNEMMGVIKDNIYLMDGFRETIVKGNIHWGSIRPIFIDKTHLENLFDIDLINKVFVFFDKARKINDDVENLQLGYNDLKDAYIQKNITIDDYVQNAILISKHIEQLQDFNEGLFDDVKSLLARVRIQIRKDKPISHVILERMIFVSGNKITVKELEAEMAQMEKELEETFTSSKKEIEKITKKRK